MEDPNYAPRQEASEEDEIEDVSFSKEKMTDVVTVPNHAAMIEFAPNQPPIVSDHAPKQPLEYEPPIVEEICVDDDTSDDEWLEGPRESDGDVETPTESEDDDILGKKKEKCCPSHKQAHRLLKIELASRD